MLPVEICLLFDLSREPMLSLGLRKCRSRLAGLGRVLKLTGFGVSGCESSDVKRILLLCDLIQFERQFYSPGFVSN